MATYDDLCRLSTLLRARALQAFVDGLPIETQKSLWAETQKVNDAILELVLGQLKSETPSGASVGNCQH